MAYQAWRLFAAKVKRQQIGNAAEGIYYHAQTCALLPELIKTHAGQFRVIYIDPPFFTQKVFRMNIKKDGGKVSLAAYDDSFADKETYLSFLRRVVVASRELLCDEGTFYLHIDERMHPYLRLMCDEVFGEENRVNEIIWAYESGGRSKSSYSKKHDTILFYQKTQKHTMNLERVAMPYAQRKNHLKREVDDEGRAYRSIRSGGKEYRYYEDALVLPGDVWTDIAHLQQRDPQRTGYETQKPEKLLERLLLPVSEEGDLVGDFFAGSGTTLRAAQTLGRKFIGIDQSMASLLCAQYRLENCVIDYRLGLPAQDIAVRVMVDEAARCIRLEGVQTLLAWAAGTLDGDTFVVSEQAQRQKNGELAQELSLVAWPQSLALRLTDEKGDCFFFTCKQ